MKKYLIIMVAALMASTSANAQRRQMSEADMQQMRTEMVQRQTERMAKDLDLKGDEKTAFMEKYAQYQTELNEAMNMGNMFNMRGEETKAEKMSDEECYEKIKESLEQQEQQIASSQKRLEITKKYMAEFMGTLTPQQLYKVFGQRQRGQRGQNGNGGQRMGGMGGFGGGFPGGGMPPMGF